MAIMDTTIISSKTKTKSVLLLSSSDFKLYLNKQYFIHLIKKKIKGNKVSLIHFLKSSDSLDFDKLDFFSENLISLNDNCDFIIKGIIKQCIKDGQFLFTKDRLGNTYKTILMVDNFSLVSQELKEKNYSCKRQYLEFLLPDKRTSILTRVSHITPRGD